MKYNSGKIEEKNNPIYNNQYIKVPGLNKKLNKETLLREFYPDTDNTSIWHDSFKEYSTSMFP